MNYATHLLRTTNYSIEEISERVGFSSLASFSRSFKEFNKESPLFYRQRLKEKADVGNSKEEIFSVLEKQKISNRST
jgi:transcriptional regulator GlxA family with amidase domain